MTCRGTGAVVVGFEAGAQRMVGTEYAAASRLQRECKLEGGSFTDASDRDDSERKRGMSATGHVEDEATVLCNSVAALCAGRAAARCRRGWGGRKGSGKRARSGPGLRKSILRAVGMALSRFVRHGK